MYIESISYTLRSFAHRHDDLPAFHAAYLTLTLLAATMLNFGVFALLIIIHMVLDYIKYREVHNFSLPMTFKGMFQESIADVALLMVGLVFSVYLHHSTFSMSMSALMRTEVTIVKAFGTIVPRFLILEHFLKTLAHLRHYLEHVNPRVYKGWSIIDTVFVLLIVASATLLFMAPALLNSDPSVVKWVLLWELVPWYV